MLMSLRRRSQSVPRPIRNSSRRMRNSWARAPFVPGSISLGIIGGRLSLFFHLQLVREPQEKLMDFAVVAAVVDDVLRDAHLEELIVAGRQQDVALAAATVDVKREAG